MATKPSIYTPTSHELSETLAEVIAGVAGGSKESWREIIGPIERLPTWQFVRFNWRVSPSGTPKQREVVDRAVDVVRAEHPYVE